MVEQLNFPPSAILQPIYGKPNYELILLWLLNNNDGCSWTDMVKIVKKSTLSNHLTRLRNRECVEKSQFNQYFITSKGKERFYELSKEESPLKKVNYPPKILLQKRNYTDMIIWMVFNNRSCKWVDFTSNPLSINQSSLSKSIRGLINKDFIEKKDKTYQITFLGKDFYSQILKKYNLDQQSILEEESRRINAITEKASSFFSKHNITDNTLRFYFLQYVINLSYDRVRQNLDNQDDFWKILLFLALNHPSRHFDLITAEQFAMSYEIKKVILDFHIMQIVDKKIFPTKFFQLQVDDEKSAYFQEHGRFEKILRAMVEDYVAKLTYLEKIQSNLGEPHPSLTMDTIISPILEDLCVSTFHPSLKKPLKYFLPDYLTYLSYKIERTHFRSGSFDNVEYLTWQDIQKNTLFSYQASKEVKYYIDSEILRLLDPIFQKKLKRIIPNIVQFLAIDDYAHLLKKISSLISKYPNRPLLHILHAYVLCFLNEFGKATVYLDKRIDVSVILGSESVYLPYVMIYSFSSFVIGNIAEATRLAKSALKKYSDSSLSNTIMGLILSYNTVYQVDPNISDDQYLHTHIDRSIDLEVFKDSKARLLLFKCQIYSDLKDHNAALKIIEQAIEFSPSHYSLYLAKIKVLLQRDKYIEIIEVINHLLRNFTKKRTNLLLKKALIFKKMRRSKEGSQIIETLLEENPDDNLLLLHHAFWMQHFNQKTSALDIMHQLSEREPNNWIFFDAYGEILMSFGEYAQAIPKFKHSLDCPKERWTMFQTQIKLGICYKELGQNVLAIEFLSSGKKNCEIVFCANETKQKWNAIANLYLAQIQESNLN